MGETDYPHTTTTTLGTKFHHTMVKQISIVDVANRKGVFFHQYNAKAHTSLVTSQKLLDLSWNALLHPPFSPDLAPLDCYLLHSMENSINDKIFKDATDIKSHFMQCFDS